MPSRLQPFYNRFAETLTLILGESGFGESGRHKIVSKPQSGWHVGDPDEDQKDQKMYIFKCSATSKQGSSHTYYLIIIIIIIIVFIAVTVKLQLQLISSKIQIVKKSTLSTVKQVQ